MIKQVKPYHREGGKKEQVAEMFDNIAHSYDFLNHFFSLGIDKVWRRRAIKILLDEKPGKVLDVATGTGDFALQLARHNTHIQITGVDISEAMLEVGRKKVAKKNLTSRLELKQGDAEHLPFDDNEFDVFTVGFGVRNFQDLEKGMKEMLRVLKPEGLGVVLEFSRPKKFPVKQLFRFYFRRVIPVVGKLVSKDARAYTYLPDSVEAFPEGEDFLSVMKRCGYHDTKCIRLSGGIASIYLGRK
ncbi:MAG: bifunctional demethylmenaquinone methyltransferase/2-methoxy-6-polyprenyl-1,4-benzoquinol methylase UbiE [Flavobacteriales bacterium]|nr:bifunctional demethylmenaquinone methyltransferase/2-methoxy-6-polyprenyl-1,4-benzoquinol methylase UbiE [Flavobacteriales bacterium]